MTHDRFDRLLAKIDTVPMGTPAPCAPLFTRPLVVEREPVITSTRRPRFVAHMVCPMCCTDGQGIEFHGTLKSGEPVHQIGAHSAGARRMVRGQERCLGAGMRVAQVDGVWQGKAAQP